MPGVQGARRGADHAHGRLTLAAPVDIPETRSAIVMMKSNMITPAIA